MRQLLKAAQARKLDRIAAAYAVAGWILVQAASITFPTFDAPQWVLRVFIIAVLVGFPLTLALAWTVVPAPRRAGKALAPSTRTDIVLLALLGLVAVLAAAQFAYELWRTPEGARPKTSTPATATEQPVAADASIAVLPFVNMSGDPKKEYFSDGISEELLNDLANIPALRVASRTSSFAFKGKSEDIKKIAKVLGVRTVLEGSIREDGKRIRITAQLINAADGYHLWSENYDRELTNVLVIQDEIARAITKALTHKLLVNTTQPGKPASIDPDAYRKYLEGQFLFGPRTKDGVTKAVALFKDVTELQPDFADGFAALGRALINHSEDFSGDKTLIPAAEKALARALELDPGNLNALGPHLDLALHKLDWTTAEADAQRMLAINPHSAITLHEMFRFYQIMGFPGRALIAARSAAELDPLSFVDKLNVAAALIHIARFDEAAAAAREALKLEPGQAYVESMLCTGYARSNRVPEARALAETFAARKLNEVRDGCLFDIAVGENRLADAQHILDGVAAKFPNIGLSASDLADNYAVAGSFDAAMTWLDRAYAAKEFALFTIPYDKAIPPAFFETPKWKEFWSRPLIKDWQAVHDRLEAEFAKGG
jgi:TolB-like protein